MVKGASGNLQKEKIINKRKHAGRRPIGIKYFEARMVYRLHGSRYEWFTTYEGARDLPLKRALLARILTFSAHFFRFGTHTIV